MLVSTTLLSGLAQFVTAAAAVGAVVVSVINSHKITSVHLSINSRMDELLRSHGQEMRAEGAKEERDAAAAKAAELETPRKGS